MRNWLGILGVVLGVSLTTPAQGQTCAEGTCVSAGDMKAFVQLAKDAQCRNTTAPTVTMDPIDIVVDRQGRVYGSGSGPKPFTMHLQWCNYTLDTAGNVGLQAAMRVEPTWGFRFRMKAMLGYLPVTALEQKSGTAGIDAGLLFEPFYYGPFNLNVQLGFRSIGVGVGLDLLKNVGVYAGWAVAYSGATSNPLVGVSFAFW
jgi:hypothetical protein